MLADPSSSFRGGKKILAPMVRAGTLPFRELCLEFGADLVYGEVRGDLCVLLGFFLKKLRLEGTH